MFVLPYRAADVEILVLVAVELEVVLSRVVVVVVFEVIEV